MDTYFVYICLHIYTYFVHIDVYILEELAQLGSSSLEEARGGVADGAREPRQPRSAPADSSSASAWVR